MVEFVVVVVVEFVVVVVGVVEFVVVVVEDLLHKVNVAK